MQRQELELAGDIGKHSQSQRNYEQNLAEMTLELWRVSDCEELVGVFRTVPLPYAIYTPFLQVRVDSIVSAVLALVK